MDINKGDNLTLSYIKSTVHLGAHTDAPNHYHAKGTSIEKRNLDLYIGKAQVIQVNLPQGSRIRSEHLKTKIQAPRILFKTLSFPDPNHWNSDFVSLSPELIDFLATQQVRLIGIDTPSVDPADDKELLSHNQIFQQDMAILEGIILDEVDPGIYELIALPLKIQGADATPVRAILLE